MTDPIETYDDGGALYQAGPFEVAAQPASEVNPGAVTVDGRTITPHTARLLAWVLQVAADRVAAEPDRETAADTVYAWRRELGAALGLNRPPGWTPGIDELIQRARALTERPADALRRPVGESMLKALRDLRTEIGDHGPVRGEDDGPRGPRWWTDTYVYAADPERRQLTALPRNPGAAPTEAVAEPVQEEIASLIRQIDVLWARLRSVDQRDQVDTIRAGLRSLYDRAALAERPTDLDPTYRTQES